MLEDRYELIGEIGSGGMSTVWSAKDMVLGRTVAIKRLHPGMAGDPESTRRFEREAQAAARLSHPGIITVFDTGRDDDGAYIVLEYVEGRNLAQILASEGALDPARAADITRQTAAAVDYSHAQGVIHRDLKPSNLMIDPDGQVRVADFGIAKTLDAGHTVTDLGEMKGTISYMAPELLEGHPASSASDIYSLAAVTYEMLTGSPPFVGENVGAIMSAIQAGVSPDLTGMASENANAIVKAMARDPSRRHDTAAEFAGALTAGATLPLATAIADGPPSPSPASEEPTQILASTPGPPPPAGDRKRSPRWAWLAVPAVAALMLLAWAMRTPDEPDDTLTVATSTTTGPSTSSTDEPGTTTTHQPSTTALSITPEAIAAEIDAFLTGLRPPEFHPKEISDIGEELDHAMTEWEEGDGDETAKELEKAIEKVDKLPESSERDQLMELFKRLADAMGIDLDDEDRGRGDDDDD